MNEGAISPDDGGTFKTINCVDVWIDGPGDLTVRPIRPSLLEQAKAARASVYGKDDFGPQRLTDRAQPGQ
jgi:hypothetical protein